MSAIEFNLLPDVKMAYVKAQRAKNLVISVAVLASAASLALLVIMLVTVDVVQKKQLNDASKSIDKYTSDLKAIPNVNKIVTVQNQLQALVGLHQSKHISSRLFIYLPQVTPTQAHINQIKVDLVASTLEISGTADNHQIINTFIDTLKFTKLKLGEDSSKNAFPSVLETSFTIDTTEGSPEYTISATFDPNLFSNNLNGATPSLVVPSLTTTRSVLEDPANTLFNGSIKSTNSQSQQGGN